MGKIRDVAQLSILLAIVSLMALGCGTLVSCEARVASHSAPGSGIEVAVPFHVIAHRGASGHAPENTLPAFALAREMGASSVELDVRMSSDGVLVLFHDSTLERKTSLGGSVADHHAETLLETDIGSWFDSAHPESIERYAGTTIPTLAALFEAHGDALHYHVELKGAQESLPEATLAAIREHGLTESVTITSFSFEQLERIRELDADVRICLLLRDAKTSLGDSSDAERASLIDLQQQRIDHALDAGFDQLGIRAAAMSREIVEYVQEKRGLEVRAWGVASMDDMEHVIAVGANGMTIDWPDRLLARLGELGWNDSTRGGEAQK